MGMEGDGVQRQTGDCCFYNRPWKTIAFLNHVPVLLIKIKIENECLLCTRLNDISRKVLPFSFYNKEEKITYQFISQGGKGNILLHIRRQIQGIYIKKAYKSIHLN